MKTLLFLVILFVFLAKSSIGRPLVYQDSFQHVEHSEEPEDHQNEDSIGSKRPFSLTQNEYILICSGIALFIFLAVCIMFGLIFYNEAKEFEALDKKKQTPEENSLIKMLDKTTRPSHSRSFGVRSKSCGSIMEMTPTKLETIPEVQAC